MKCPACTGTLKEFSTEHFSVDICSSGCAGIWFDAAEFEKCDQASEHFPPQLLRVQKNSLTVIDRNKNRLCPKCPETILTRIALNKDRFLEIDHCPSCLGHWLDIGELENIRKESKTTTEIAERVAAFEKRTQDALHDPIKAKKVRAIVELLFKE